MAFLVEDSINELVSELLLFLAGEGFSICNTQIESDTVMELDNRIRTGNPKIDANKNRGSLIEFRRRIVLGILSAQSR